MYHKLTDIDSIAIVNTYLFRTEAGARGYAAKQPRFLRKRYDLDGQPCRFTPDDAAHAEEQVGHVDRGQIVLTAEPTPAA